MKMHENSLFAILLRSPWWISFLVAGLTAALSRLVLEKFDMHPLYAVFVASPFFVVGCVAGWRQLRAPSAASVAARMEALRALSWDEFSAQLESAFRRQGYEVSRLQAAGADLALAKSGRTLLVSCKRWKASRTGVEPLRELDAARQAREAHECVFVAAGEVSDNARSFAAKAGIRLVEGAGLAGLLAETSAGGA